jgi:NitT/TauT family transport system ATP-binding protein
LKIWDELRPTILFVTHDVREAALLADRVLVLSPRPGRIVADVPIRSPRPRKDSDDAFISVQMHLLRAMGVSESR